MSDKHIASEKLKGAFRVQVNCYKRQKSDVEVFKLYVYDKADNLIHVSNKPIDCDYMDFEREKLGIQDLKTRFISCFSARDLENDSSPLLEAKYNNQPVPA